MVSVDESVITDSGFSESENDKNEHSPPVPAKRLTPPTITFSPVQPPISGVVKQVVSKSSRRVLVDFGREFVGWGAPRTK